jgi:hypothetical protein
MAVKGFEKLNFVDLFVLGGFGFSYADKMSLKV